MGPKIGPIIPSMSNEENSIESKSTQLPSAEELVAKHEFMTPNMARDVLQFGIEQLIADLERSTAIVNQARTNNVREVFPAAIRNAAAAASTARYWITVREDAGMNQSRETKDRIKLVIEKLRDEYDALVAIVQKDTTP